MGTVNSAPLLHYVNDGRWRIEWVIAKSISEAAETGNNVNQGSGSNAKSSSNKPAPIDTSNLTGAANDSKKRSASIVGKSTFRALLSLDEKELVVGRSPGSAQTCRNNEETPTPLAQLSGKQIKKAQKKLQKKSGGPVKMQRKMNTTSTLLSFNATMENAPTEITIRCMSYVIRTHIAGS